MANSTPQLMQTSERGIPIESDVSRTSSVWQRTRFKSHWLFLGLLLVLYMILFWYYYPCTHAIEDEVGYINQALVWSRGSVSAQGAGFDRLREFIDYDGRNVCWRNPGRSVLILPFLLAGGPSAVFISGAVIHLALTLLCAFIFRRIDLSPLWALLVLCHPTLAIYSRTVMADPAAALGLCAALLAYVHMERWGLWCGLAIGAAAVSRYQAGLALPFFAVAAATSWRLPGRELNLRQPVLCLLIGLAIGGLLVIYNYSMYGNALGWVNQGSFSLYYLPRNLPFFATALMIVWPLMLLALLVDKSPLCWVIRAICLPLFALMLAWHAYDRHSSWLYTLVIGQRYLIPILPAWLIAYALCLQRLLSHSPLVQMPQGLIRVLVGGSCVALLALLTLVFQRHDTHLNNLKSARDELARLVPPDSLVIGNYTLGKLFGVPSGELPTYRWLDYDVSGTPLDHSTHLAGASTRWYLAILPKFPGDELPAVLQEYVRRYRMTRIESRHTSLILYEADPTR